MSEISSSNPNRIDAVDYTRGVACLSMPIFHTVYNLHSFGFSETILTKTLFWQIYQHLGLGTFVIVSGVAFTLSTQSGIRWERLLKRAGKLAFVAAIISLVTFLIMPEKFVRFGVIHFFTVTIILAPLFKALKHWALVPGLAIVVGGVIMTKAGLYPEPWLYPTGLMSERPRSIDYIPLVPWFGVFLMGMGLANWLRPPKEKRFNSRVSRGIIWLGKHSLPFYVIHQIAIFALLSALAFMVK